LVEPFISKHRDVPKNPWENQPSQLVILVIPITDLETWPGRAVPPESPQQSTMTMTMTMLSGGGGDMFAMILCDFGVLSASSSYVHYNHTM